MDPKNELEILLLKSLKQLSEEFEARQKQISEQYLACMKAFKEQSDALGTRYELVSQQLNASAARYEQVMALLKTLNASLGN